MNIERALTVEGFMEPIELEYLANAASKCKRIAEIGSWKGRSASAMAMNTSGLVYCVDTWSGHLEASDHFSADCFKDFLRNTKDLHNVLPIPLESSHACAIFREFGFTFDMIFLDGRHDYEGISADITNWKTVLAPGAILCGHDLGHSDWPDVQKAVELMIPDYRRVPNTNIWTTETI
jgi:predicted O-methyltransferase YrrM